ncbi:uncharacterized protein LOC141817755 [Curcuma longa]|uniref:uncharacterized protein LOC141817755 n=1 Tax=Curcuma longa TaxID=136217 RepID=UPI003D9DB40B
MEAVLCDELVQEILRRLSPSAAPSASLASKRWLSLLRSSTTSLSLAVRTRLPNSPSLSSILAHYPSVSDLTVVSDREEEEEDADADALVFAIASAACTRRLTRLRFIPAAPVSPSALQSSAAAFASLTSLQIASLFPLSFRWLAALPFLKSFSLIRSRAKRPSIQELPDDDDDGENSIVMLPLESLSLSGIYASYRGLSLLWRRCGGLRWLQLRRIIPLEMNV